MGDDLGRDWPFVDRDPPVPVVVDLSHLFSAPTGALRDPPTLGCRAAGIKGSHQTPGMLMRWVRTSQGLWLGLCEVELSSPNGRARLTVRQLAPAAHIVPRPANAAHGAE